MLLARSMATLKELETYYSYEDALNMLEVLKVTDFNTRKAWESK